MFVVGDHTGHLHAAMLTRVLGADVGYNVGPVLDTDGVGLSFVVDMG